VCVWVSGASLDSLSPGPQHRHRGRLRHVSLPPRRSQAELSHVSAKRELTLNRDVEAESIQRRVAASTRRAWSDIATQHRGGIAASPRSTHPRAAGGRGGRLGLAAARLRAPAARAEPPRGRASGRAPRGLVCSLLLDVPPRGASLFILDRYTVPAAPRGDAEKKMYRPNGVPRRGPGRGPGQGQGNTHTGVPRGRRSIRKDVR